MSSSHDLFYQCAINTNTDTLFTSGSIDKSTWAEEYYEPLLDEIWKDIMPHAYHQQCWGKYVQMAALIPKLLVEEVRRTWQAVAVSIFIRRFNPWAIETRQKEETNKTKRDNMKRVEDRY